MKKNKSRFIFLIVLAAFAIFYFILQLNNKFIAYSANKYLKTACSICELKIESLHINIFNGHFELNDVIVKYEEKNRTELEWKIKKLKGQISYYRLLKGEVELSNVEMNSPDVQLLDGDAPSQNADNQSDSKPLKIAINDMKVNDGTFVFLRKEKNSLAKISFHKINANLDALGNTPHLISKTTQCIASGQVEKSGKVDLKIESAVFMKPLEVNIDIAVVKQNLGDLTTYFKENYGLSFQGTLIEGTGKVRLKDNIAKTEVYSKFQNFNLLFNKTSERSPTLTFFMNLAKAITFEEKNTKKAKSKQTQNIQAKREKDESLVGFILRSLKEAAIKVASTD